MRSVLDCCLVLDVKRANGCCSWRAVGTLKQHTWVGFKGGKQLPPLASLILRWILLQDQRHICFELIRLKRVNPATAWSTRPSPYVKRHMFSPLTQRRLSAVNQLVNAPLALRVDSGLPAPGTGPPAARSSSSSESSWMMHPLAAARPAPSHGLGPARNAARWIAAGSGPSYPSRPGSMLNVRQVSAGPPSLPFSHRTHVAVQASQIHPLPTFRISRVTSK